jgi:alpha-glucoside transport system substrate-binding protein
MKKTVWQLMTVLLIAGMFLSACAPQAATTPAPAAAEPTATTAAAEPTAEPTMAPEATETTAAEPTAEATVAATEAATAGATDYATVGQELADAFAGKYKGTTVTMAGPFVDADAVAFNDSIKDFEDKTGIKIEYSGSKEFEASIRIAVEGGNAPDIADFPQPGLLASLASGGKVLDASKIINPDWLKKNYKQSWLDMATMKSKDGEIMAGIWARANGKDLVWYPKKEFDAAGYKVPETWDDLMALTDQIAEDGDTPWCVGIESGAATGWPLTDWVEAMMLRTTTPENYDKWVSGELKFDSPEIRKALDYVTKIWFEDKYVYGGRKAIATTPFGDSVKPMFENPPKCWLHKQGNFITTFFPEGKEAGVDYDFFYLPPIDPSLGMPFEVAGDIYAMFNDRPEVRAVFQYFSMGESLKGWVENGGAISPHNDASLDWYKDPVTKKIAQIMQDATVVRFDASDLMPGAVGAGSFWKSMTSFVTGSIDEDTALKEIDASWPK